MPTFQLKLIFALKFNVCLSLRTNSIDICGPNAQLSCSVTTETKHQLYASKEPAWDSGFSTQTQKGSLGLRGWTDVDFSLGWVLGLASMNDPF